MQKAETSFNAHPAMPSIEASHPQHHVTPVPEPYLPVVWFARMCCRDLQPKGDTNLGDVIPPPAPEPCLQAASFAGAGMNWFILSFSIPAFGFGTELHLLKNKILETAWDGTWKNFFACFSLMFPLLAHFLGRLCPCLPPGLGTGCDCSSTRSEVVHLLPVIEWRYMHSVSCSHQFCKEHHGLLPPLAKGYKFVQSFYLFIFNRKSYCTQEWKRNTIHELHFPLMHFNAE